MMANYGIWGGLALLAGVVILFFPKIVFHLIGLYLVINAAVALWQGAEIWLITALALGGILVIIAPKMVAWFIAFYLVVFSVLLFFWGYWFLAIPGVLLAFIVVITPKILPTIAGGTLGVVGALTVFAAFFF